MAVIKRKLWWPHRWEDNKYPINSPITNIKLFNSPTTKNSVLSRVAMMFHQYYLVSPFTILNDHCNGFHAITKKVPKLKKNRFNTSSGNSWPTHPSVTKSDVFKLNCIMWNHDITNRTIRQCLNKGRSLQIWDFRRWHFPNNDWRKSTKCCWRGKVCMICYPPNSILQHIQENITSKSSKFYILMWSQDQQMVMEICINSPQTIIWWYLNHYYCNNRQAP